MKNFLIISSPLQKEGTYKLKLISRLFDYCFYTEENKILKFNDIIIFIDGYVIPRFNYFETWKDFEQYDLIYFLFKKHGDNFVEYIKGFFCIIIIESDKIKIFTDHLGIYKLFYKQIGTSFECSNSVKQLSNNSELNPEMLQVKSILNHEINGNTIFKNIHYSQPATKIVIENKTVKVRKYFDYSTFLEQVPIKTPYQYFADLIKKLIYQYNSYLQPSKSIISLTGGKDCRTLLTALLANEINATGITYGNPESGDAVHARLVAEKTNINHHIFNPDKTVSWYESESISIINKGNPLINVHRSHRCYAFRKMHEIVGDNVSYYAGYMGGELLMGIYYDNLIFTKYLTEDWEDPQNNTIRIEKILSERFIRSNAVDLQHIEEQLSRLKSLDPLLDKKIKQFHGLFEIGVLHHGQDLFLAHGLFKYPTPLFLDIDFLQELFKSYYSFIYRNNKTKNLLKRYPLYEFNLNIQHILHPALDSVFFAKKGTYNTNEFLKGPLYWSIVKSWRYLFERKNYPPSFDYNGEYKKFILKWLNEIMLDKTSDIHAVYNVEDALRTITVSPVHTNESTLFPYSSIIMHYLQQKNKK